MLNLGKVLDEIGIGYYAWLMIVLVGGIAFTEGCCLTLFACVEGTLADKWNLTPLDEALGVSVAFAGIAASSFASGRLADVHGRRTLVLVSYVGMVSLGLVASLVRTEWQMLLARFLWGCSYGLGVGPRSTLLVECTPSSWRGSLLIFVNGGCYSLGVLYAVGLVLMYMPDLKSNDGIQWRYMTALSVAPAATIFPFAALLLQESPHFLAAQHDKVGTVHSLRFIAQVCGRDQIVHRLNQELEMPGDEAIDEDSCQSRQSHGQADGVTPLIPRKDGVGGDTPPEGEGCRPCPFSMPRVSDVMPSKKFRGLLLAGCYLSFLSQFSSCGLNYALPSLFTSGVGMSASVEFIATALCNAPGLMMALVLTGTATMSYRSSLGLMQLAMPLLLLTMLCIHNKSFLWLCLPAACMLNAIVLAFSLVWDVYLAEIFPSSIRCTAVSVSLGAGRLGAIVAPVIFAGFQQLGDPLLFFIFNCPLCAIGAVTIWQYCTVDLRGKPLSDFEEPETCGHNRTPNTLKSRPRQMESEADDSCVESEARSPRFSNHLGELDLPGDFKEAGRLQTEQAESSVGRLFENTRSSNVGYSSAPSGEGASASAADDRDSGEPSRDPSRSSMTMAPAA
eukprot:TRINITY_DN4659_c0_g1_i1.p1 TRINITY_DN4659_c0_g1~~TRINITY_DN4659_c0_g1_i1.p1  ORF type:complete len:618 (+),score=65.28 TRINITY_DN4659_c0_g1_i1:178-2031(+)